ncbi:SGNH/GDSL hydrolase family protein [Dyadobacter tibetensis]|uniref:SGNH/GDSL hydrolase family protein n=1 Tax=Dyadobacter tibetensis TaxID=1211851 RepID=UPI0018DB5815|nr:SGNH/GDSL hydrolase family protein [Dyadobacter tibetensis]
MAENRIVILGDSLAMPRIMDGIRFEDTYAYHLAKEFEPDFTLYNRAKRANTFAKQAVEWTLNDDFICYNPKIVIIHLGIVDCAPRLFSELQNKVIEMMPAPIRKPIITFFSKRRLFFTRLFKKVYVDKKCFEAGIRSILTHIDSSKQKTIIVGIAPTNTVNANRSYGFEANIMDYNNILKNVAATKENTIFLDVRDQINPDIHLLPDGIHLTKEGHLIISKMIINHLNNSLKLTAMTK